MEHYQVTRDVSPSNVSLLPRKTVIDHFPSNTTIWDTHGGQDRPLIENFTSSVYLAAPPPSIAMKTLTGPFTCSPLLPSSSRQKSTDISPSYSSPVKINPQSSAAPVRSLTSSFYMSTGPPPQKECSSRVISLNSSRTTGLRSRYNSTSSGSPSSTDSCTISFDFSVPSHSEFIIDSQNSSPLLGDTSSDMIFSDVTSYSQHPLVEKPTNPMPSVYQINLNTNQSSSSVHHPIQSRNLDQSESQFQNVNQSQKRTGKQFDQLYRRASFEIHSTDSNVENCRSTNEILLSRRHSVQPSQSNVVSHAETSKYNDYPEDLLVDMLKKCTDFPERRRIRSALRYVRENKKASDEPKPEMSTFCIPFQQQQTEADPPSISMATVKLSPREVDQGQISPVLTSTPRDLPAFTFIEEENQTSGESPSFEQIHEAHYHFEIPSIELSSRDSYFSDEDSTEDRRSPKVKTDVRKPASSSGTAPRKQGANTSSRHASASPSSTSSSPRIRPESSQGETLSGVVRKTSIKVALTGKPKDSTKTVSKVDWKSESQEKNSKEQKAKSARPIKDSADSVSISAKSTRSNLVCREASTPVASPRQKLPNNERRSSSSDTRRPARSPRKIDDKQSKTTSSRKREDNSRKGEAIVGKNSEQIKPSDSVIVKTATENIIIPRVIISDESEATNEELIATQKTFEKSSDKFARSSPVNRCPSKEKPTYHRQKEHSSSSGAQSDENKMSAIVAMETRSKVIKPVEGNMKSDLENNNNNKVSNNGDADLEKAFSDLLNFHASSAEVTESKGNNNISETNSNEKLASLPNSVTKGAINNLHGKNQPEERTNSNSLTKDKGNTSSQQTNIKQTIPECMETEDLSNISGNTGDDDLSTLESIEEEAFDVERLGDVKVEESDDGALTVTDVQEFDQGQRKVSVTTKKKRTDSEAEYQDKETTVVTTFESPSGTKYQEQDVIKTRCKLTPKGSFYIKKDTVRTKSALSKTGEQTVEEDHVVETDNKSVSLGKSWGDKTLTTMVLSKPTKSSREIPSIKEEITPPVRLPDTKTEACGAIEEETTPEAKPTEVKTEACSPAEGIPDITSALADQHVTLGSEVTLKCQGQGQPTPEVKWYAGSSVVTETAYFKPEFDRKTASLTITEVFPDDEKLYRCVFSNKHGSAETRCRLTVIASQVEDVPAITEALEDIEVSPGTEVIFECRVKGLGEVFWHKEGTRLKGSARYLMQVRDKKATLTIKDATFDDAGQYSCSVKNSAGEASSICQLTIVEIGCPPDVLNPLFNCSATVGKPFKLLCRISGDPPPTVKWLHNGRELCQTSACIPSFIDNIARLELKSISLADKGVYECIGTNSLGSASTNCELSVKEDGNQTKASIQLNLSSVYKSIDKEESFDLNDGVRRLESSQSLDVPSSQSEIRTTDEYSKGKVRSCTPPPQVQSCSPPRPDTLSCPPPHAKVFNASFPSTIPSPSDDQSNTPAFTKNGHAEKSSAVNRLQNFFGSIMNNNTTTNGINSSPTNFIRSPGEEQQVETKNSFVVKKPDRATSQSSDTKDTPIKNKVVASEDFGDLSTLHRDIIMSAKIQEMEDEEALHKMLNTTDSYEDRKMIRARLKQLREKARDEWERGRKEREAAAVDVVKLRQQRADEDKKRKMASFQTRAETAGKDLEDKYLSQTQKDLEDRQKFAADDKQKKLDAYAQIAKTGSGVSETRVSTRTTTDNDGKTTTTTTKTVTVKQSSGGSSSTNAENLANQLHNVSSPYTSGKITVRTESWNSQEGYVKKSETTQRWGAPKKPAGPRGAMAAFKQMDTLNPGAAPAKPKWGAGSGGSTTTGGGGGTKIVRNPSAIKQMLLDWCKAMTAEYEEVNVTNFSSSWNNGMAFCALIHHFYPDSFDFKSLNPKERRKNFTLAFDTAENCADIAPLLDVEDMVKMKNPDWKCVFTYVQSFYRILRNHPNCKQIAPPSQ